MQTAVFPQAAVTSVSNLLVYKTRLLQIGAYLAWHNTAASLLPLNHSAESKGTLRDTLLWCTKGIQESL